MTTAERGELIIRDIMKESGVNPVRVFKKNDKKEYISIHGPEHHILDGASILMAYKNAGGNIDLAAALEKLCMKASECPGLCADFGEYVVQFLPAVQLLL